jgi:hypothetical protein
MGQFACHACDKTVVFWARASVERGANLQVTQYRRAILQRKNSQVQTIGGLFSALLTVQAGATRQVHIDLGMRIAGTFHQQLAQALGELLDILGLALALAPCLQQQKPML